MDYAYIAIGDIHGLAETLQALLARLPAAGTLVFLGDYVDRGPATRRVVDHLLALEQERPCIFLRGNHEDMMLSAFAGDQDALFSWLHNGGVQTLESYHHAIPDDHLAFYLRTLPYYETDDYIFVHGGIPPGRHPADVEAHQLFWIRDPFLQSDYDWGKLVIHGHTPVPTGRPDCHPNRVNIETAAVYGGRLTALLLPAHRADALSLTARNFRTVKSRRK